LQPLAIDHDLTRLTDGLLAASVLILSEVVPTIKSSAKQRIAILLWTGVLVFLFSLLVRLFKIKNGGA
jgi:oligosaccharyltransferase complex subunit gamma